MNEKLEVNPDGKEKKVKSRLVILKSTSTCFYRPSLEFKL